KRWLRAAWRRPTPARGGDNRQGISAAPRKPPRPALFLNFDTATHALAIHAYSLAILHRNRQPRWVPRRETISVAVLPKGGQYNKRTSVRIPGHGGKTHGGRATAWRPSSPGATARLYFLTACGVSSSVRSAWLF